MKNFLLCATLLALHSFARAQAPAAAVPPIHGTLLTGPAVDLPADLHGRPVIFVMGFSQDSREQVAAWGRRLAHDYATSPNLAYYELAQLQSVPRLLRGLVLRKVAASVPERARPHFVVVTDHESEWKQAVAFKAPDDAYILLVDPSGTIRARAQGPATDQAWAALQTQIQTQIQTQSQPQSQIQTKAALAPSH